MKIVSFIEPLELIEKIVWHLGYWDIRNYDSPAPDPVHIYELVYDDSDSQVPVFYHWN